MSGWGKRDTLEIETALLTKGAIVLPKGKSNATLFATLAIIPGVLLALAPGIFAASRSPLTDPTVMPLAADPGGDSACQAALDAGDKLFTTPYHAYMTESADGAPNGKPVTHESIFADGVLYILEDGRWRPSGMSSEVMRAMERRNRENARNMSCHFVRDEPVNGEEAALFSTHQETVHGKLDGQTWISKGSGLILRQEIDIDAGRPNGKTHMSARYEYGNVRAPKP
jgi:hypothetical protein